MSLATSMLNTYVLGVTPKKPIFNYFIGPEVLMSNGLNPETQNPKTAEWPLCLNLKIHLQKYLSISIKVKKRKS